MARQRKEQPDGMVEVRVVAPNLHITMPDGVGDLTPAVGDVISVRRDQVDGGLVGKVRPLSEEPKGGMPASQALTPELARGFLEKQGFLVVDPSDGVGPLVSVVEAGGYTVTKRGKGDK